MDNISSLFEEYSQSHRNATNQLIHWICVPLIYLAILGLFYGYKLPLSFRNYDLNLSHIALIPVIIYYIRLSKSIALGMFVFSVVCMLACEWLESSPLIPLWAFCMGLFLLAWTGQFIGHQIEGKKPSFLKDIQFLLIGPAWLLGKLYKKWGIAIS